MALLNQAYALYEELGSAEGTARVRARLCALGTRLCHWTHQDRPAFGWDSLTDTERTITDLVAQGLSNRQVASRVFLSTHTVAFHLRMSSGSSASPPASSLPAWPPSKPPNLRR